MNRSRQKQNANVKTAWRPNYNMRVARQKVVSSDKSYVYSQNL